jgi:uncharacterized protein (DUF1778 family)
MRQSTKLPLSLSPDDRQILESVAQLKGLRLSTWVRAAALEASRGELVRRRQLERQRAAAEEVQV